MVPGNRFRMLLLMTRLVLDSAEFWFDLRKSAAVRGLRSAFLHYQVWMKSVIQTYCATDF
jgi:hypothetical protein